MRKIMNHLQLNINNQNKIKKKLLLISSIIQFEIAINKKLSCNFNAFLNQDRMSQKINYQII